jgi:hypothetical protein
MEEPLPADVVEAAVHVCGTAFHWKSTLRTLFINAGVPEGLWKAASADGAVKFVIARRVLDELAQRGRPGRRVEWELVRQLASLTRPEPKAPDPTAGTRAIADLKRLAVEHKVLVDPQAAERDRRRAEAAAARDAATARRTSMENLKDQFSALATRGPERAQERGYALERLLADLFQVHDIEYRPSFRAPHEQLDGAFTYQAFTYLVEARWRAQPPTWGDLVEFKAKVDGKIESTRGLFVSVAGFDPAAIEHFLTTVSGTRRNTILVSGQDLMVIFDGRMSLIDALEFKIGKASHEGVLWAPLV